ncbi:MAG: HIT family protein [Crocinitomicaceae bacterium]|jgi:histidine triad (HIT) family protein|nr:HIT family protein [Crocinitomicaceae bacterium]MDP4865199.1 HIT family protein [Crocinitomicaceae bacterium]MDP5010480.1 HIT family protein [Crocinitomicaceae bacterium]MDP5098701.1 HIT family protein [Crocinitomicaceae bacterium]
MASIFSKIIAGEIPCYKVQENESFLAFLDIQPLRKGHVLVIPKVEVDNIFDIEDELLGEMMIFSKSVAKRIQQNFDCKKVGVTVIGLEVPHAHIHLIPINSLADMDFSQDKLSLTTEELTEICAILQK